jgi:uncharacterized repeat protein (TIGR01451 family)
MKLKTLAFIAASSAMTLPAFAAGYDITELDTLFGTDVSNTASLTYQINGTNIGETSNTVEFVVDRKVIFSVTDNQTATGPVVVNAGDDAVTTYTIQNDSNAPISFELTAPPAGTTYSYAHPVTGATITVVNGDAASIIPLPAGDGLTATTTDQVEITVTLTVPNDAESGDQIFTPLNITAVEPADNTEIGTGVLAGDTIVATESTEVWDEDVIQTITIADFLNTDGSVKVSSTQEFIVAASDIDLVKSVAILSDPVNGTTNPKAIPGAVVEYTLTIYNLGAVAASGITLTDTVPSVFNVADTGYTELFYDENDATIDSANIGVVGNEITISNISVAADTDTSDSTLDVDGNIEYKTTDGKTIIKFTVTLP